MNRPLWTLVVLGLAALLGTAAVCAERGQGLDAEDERTVRTVLDSIALLHQRLDARKAELQARFDKIDLGHYLEPAQLASSSDLQAARGDLVRYRALLTERDRLNADAAAQGHALLAGLPQGGLREAMLRNEARLAEGGREIRAELLRTQVANADAMEAVIDWADRNHALVHLRGDKLAIDGRQNLDQFDALQAHLDATARSVQEAADRAQAAQDEGARAGADLRQVIAK